MVFMVDHRVSAVQLPDCVWPKEPAAMDFLCLLTVHWRHTKFPFHLLCRILFIPYPCTVDPTHFRQFAGGPPAF